MKTLAQFIQEKREKIGLSASGLAKKANLELALIEEIEASQMLFLAVTVRQNLAKVLKCAPDEIKAFEKNFDMNYVPAQTADKLKESILNDATELYCPACGAALVTRVVKMYDLDDNLVLHPKAHCSKCVFQIS